MDCRTCKCSTLKAETQHSQSRLTSAAALIPKQNAGLVPKQSLTTVQQHPEDKQTFPKLCCSREWLCLSANQKTTLLKKRKPLWQVKQKSAKWPEALEYKQLHHSQQWEESLKKMLYSDNPRTLSMIMHKLCHTDWGMCWMQPQQDQTHSEMLGWSCMCTIPTTRKKYTIKNQHWIKK